MTTISVVCNNTLNLDLYEAKRIWAIIHSGDIKSKLVEAMKTLLIGEYYMKKLDYDANYLNRKKIDDKKVIEFIGELIPFPDNTSRQQAKNIIKLKYLKHLILKIVNAFIDYARRIKSKANTLLFVNVLLAYLHYGICVASISSVPFRRKYIP